MDIDKQEQMHLDRLLETKTNKEFGPSFVQRTCRIGYNNACRIIERGISQGVLTKGEKPWLNRIAL